MMNESILGNAWIAVMLPLLGFILTWLFFGTIGEVKNLYDKARVPFRLSEDMFRNVSLAMFAAYAVAWGYSLYYLGEEALAFYGLFFLNITAYFSSNKGINSLTFASFLLQVAILILIIWALFQRLSLTPVLWIPIILFTVYMLWTILLTYQTYSALFFDTESMLQNDS